MHMKQMGVEDCKIATVLGHKSINSFKAYDRTTKEEARMMSAVIDKNPVSAPLSSLPFSLPACLPQFSAPGSSSACALPNVSTDCSLSAQSVSADSGKRKCAT